MNFLVPHALTELFHVLQKGTHSVLGEENLSWHEAKGEFKICKIDSWF